MIGVRHAATKPAERRRGLGCHLPVGTRIGASRANTPRVRREGLRGGKVPRAWVVEKSGSVAAPRRIFGPTRSISAESRTRTFTGRVRRASDSRAARDGASTRPAARPRCRTPRDRPLCAGRDGVRIRAAGKAGISSAAGTRPTGCWPAWARRWAARSRLPARAQRRPRGRARPRRDCARAGNPGRRPRCSVPCAAPRA